MKKLTLTAAALLASLTIGATAHADTSRDAIERAGEAQIAQKWSEYQQALQDRQNAWNDSHGNRYGNAYIEADAHAGASYREWLELKTKLSDDLHNYDVEHAISQEDNTVSKDEDTVDNDTQNSQREEATNEDKAAEKTPQDETKTVQPNDSIHPQTVAKPNDEEVASKPVAKDDNKSVNEPQSAGYKTDKSELPQTGNDRSYGVAVAGLLATVGAIVLCRKKQA